MISEIKMAVSRCPATGHGSFKTIKMPCGPNFFKKNFDGTAYSNTGRRGVIFDRIAG